MKKTALIIVLLMFAIQIPSFARTKYDRWGHKIEPAKKKTPVVQAAAKTEEEKIKVKDIEDGRGRSLGKAVRDGDSDNFTFYNQRGRKMGSYVEDKDGNGKYYDLRGREIRVKRQTQDIE